MADEIKCQIYSYRYQNVKISIFTLKGNNLPQFTLTSFLIIFILFAQFVLVKRLSKTPVVSTQKDIKSKTFTSGYNIHLRIYFLSLDNFMFYKISE